MQSWTRRIAATAGAVGIAALAGGIPNVTALAAPARNSSVTNPYSPAYGHAYRRGVVPTQGQSQKMKNWASHQAGAAPTGAETLSYGGGIDGIGVTEGPPRIYLVFWGSQWGTQGTDSNGNYTFTKDTYHGAPYIQQLFKGLGTGGEMWSGTMTQYCDGAGVSVGAVSCPSGASFIGYPTGGPYAGVWYDNSTTEPSIASANQIGSEAVRAANHFGNTTPTQNRDVQYDILSAPGLNPDRYFNSYCAWHDYTGDATMDGGGAVNTGGDGDIAFTNMPYLFAMGANCGAGFVNSGDNLDGYSIVNGHEYAETVTDQNPAGGWTNATGSSFNGQENGDECAWITPGTPGGAGDVSMGTGKFAMQSTWSNDTNECDLSHAIVTGTPPANDFSISTTPSSATVIAGNGATATVNTTVTAGSGTVNLSVSGAPAGVTAALGSSSVSAGSGTSLTISTTTTATTGTYPITVTGTEGTAIHSTTYTLTVNPVPGSNAIVNGGFETGTFSGWSTSGAATNIVTSPVHSGSYAAVAGYFSPTGTSSIAQTFTAPSSSSNLTFWYYTVCGGSFSSNYATVTLRDNTGGVTTTPLAKTCATTSGWRQVTVSITAGHNYTLTLQNRDSRTRTTYAAYDDVSTS